MGILTANGLLVRFLSASSLASISLGGIVPIPMVPSPPALETAAASRLLLIFPMPPCMIGYLICKISVNLFNRLPLP
ncbi:Uncharacterised protein [Mycobacteroides abscessus subsp. abscessus]|nr:Uncharacterised protein [Mycobacteroides abscessus subsp. abscessus]